MRQELIGYDRDNSARVQGSRLAHELKEFSSTSSAMVATP